MVEELTPQRPNRRVSITKLQRETASGAELIAICQSITEDGSVTSDEVYSLKRWLEANRDCQLPASQLLFSTVERVIADGKITSQERDDLHRAIEKVLPPDIRNVIRRARQAAQRAETARARATQQTFETAARAQAAAARSARREDVNNLPNFPPLIT